MLEFQGKALQFFFSFSFSFFTSFYFGRLIGLLFMGVLNLLKVVNNTRSGFARFRRLDSFFFSLSLKPNVHSVWLARGGRKRSKAIRFQLIIHSIRHGTNLTSTELDNVSTFQTAN